MVSDSPVTRGFLEYGSRLRRAVLYPLSYGGGCCAEMRDAA